jgi:uncharacterized membrane protein
MEKNRLEAFSDGVLAIIITIMVLEIKVPHGYEWANLTPLLPVFIGYILSFLYIGIYWGNHHHLIHTVKKVTPGIMISNLNLLFWLSLIPFATGWMGENYFNKNTVALYGIILLVSAISYFILQTNIEKSHTHSKKINYAFEKHRKKGIISLACYALSIPLSYVNPIISIIIFYGLAIYWFIPDKNIQEALEKEKKHKRK